MGGCVCIENVEREGGVRWKKGGGAASSRVFGYKERHTEQIGRRRVIRYSFILTRQQQQ